MKKVFEKKKQRKVVKIFYSYGGIPSFFRFEKYARRILAIEKEEKSARQSYIRVL